MRTSNTRGDFVTFFIKARNSELMLWGGRKEEGRGWRGEGMEGRGDGEEGGGVGEEGKEGGKGERRRKKRKKEEKEKGRPEGWKEVEKETNEGKYSDKEGGNRKR